MGELAAWIMGLSLGFAYPKPFGTCGRAIFLVAIIALVGSGITVLSGEWQQEPYYALVDIGQVALASWIGSFARKRIWSGEAAVSISRAH